MVLESKACLPLVLLLLRGACFAPPPRSGITSFVSETYLAGYENVRARDGYFSPEFQASFTQHLGQRKTE